MELVAPVPSVALALSGCACQLMKHQEAAAQKAFARSSQFPSLAPSITSVLGKHPPLPPPPTSPPLELGFPVALAALDWRAWMQHKQAIYLCDDPGKVVPEKVTPLNLRDAALAAATAPSLTSPFFSLTALSSDQLCSSFPLSLPSQISPESREYMPTLRPRA